MKIPGPPSKFLTLPEACPFCVVAYVVLFHYSTLFFLSLITSHASFENSTY